LHNAFPDDDFETGESVYLQKGMIGMALPEEEDVVET
jgi:hypothetical protein